MEKREFFYVSLKLDISAGIRNLYLMYRAIFRVVFAGKTAARKYVLVQNVMAFTYLRMSSNLLGCHYD